jgi:hypothetical protein
MGLLVLGTAVVWYELRHYSRKLKKPQLIFWIGAGGVLSTEGTEEHLK